MTRDDLAARIHNALVWVGSASAFVAVLDICALILLLKYWIDLEAFGLATAVLAFHGAFELFAELGICAAIIQKRTQTDTQVSTLYWLSLLLGFLVAAVIWFSAPLFALLHKNQMICPMFRLYALQLIIRPLYACHQALMKRELRFRELSSIRLGSNSADFLVRITTAASGAGPWCFIYGLLARTIVEGAGVILACRWSPRLVFRLGESREHIIFGLKSSTSELIYRLYSNSDYWAVSIFLGPSTLGLYRAAYELILEPVRFISQVIINVAFPAFSRLRGNSTEAAAQLARFTRTNLVIIGLFVACILACAEQLLSVIFTPEYVAAGWTARILSVVAILRSVSHLGPPFLDGMGRPGLTLRYQLLTGIICSALFFITARCLGPDYGIIVVAFAWSIGYPAGFGLLLYLIASILKAPLKMIFHDSLRIFVCIAFATACAFPVDALFPGAPTGLKLTLGLLLTSCSYLFLLSVIAGITPRSVISTFKR